MGKGSGGQHGQQGPTASRPTFRLIQILRVLAALMVVAHHATITLAQRNHLPIATWINGASGVDLFFVISGFVMTISSAPLRTARYPLRTFLARRIERVVPMYWLVTTLKVAVLLSIPALGINAMGGFRHVLSSYLFIPSYNPQAAVEPVVVVGWTLNFEMAFYVLFAVALATRAKPLWIIAPPILAIAVWRGSHNLLGPVALSFFESTLPLEFLFGAALGTALPYVQRLHWTLGLGAILCGLPVLLFWREAHFSVLRGLYWGVPALLVVAGAISMEDRWGRRSPRWLLELGDASYSIYLVHTFSLPVVGMLLSRVHHGWTGEVSLSMVAALVFSTAAGEVTYRLVERPMNGWFKGRRRAAVPAVG